MTETPSGAGNPTRRALIGGATLAAAAVIAETVNPSTARAATGDPVVAGWFVSATDKTSISNDGSSSQTDGTGLEVYGAGFGGNGLFAQSFGSNAAVEADANGAANGITGTSGASIASGVYGENTGGGFGMAGRVTNGGVAVLADSAGGTGVALRTTGTLQFQNRSGIATIASGRKSVTVTLAAVTATSMVTATVQQTGGYFVQAAVPAAESFTVYINKAPTTPATVKISYLVLN